MSICDLKPGNSAFVHSISCDDKLSKRLLALGFIRGTKVVMKTVAPLGDPIILTVRGYDLAIRKKDAKNILVKGI